MLAPTPKLLGPANDERVFKPGLKSLGRSFNILLCGHKGEAVEELRSYIEGIPGATVNCQLLGDGELKLMDGAEGVPDLLIYWLGEQWRQDLESLIDQGSHEQTDVIIVGDVLEKDALRMAMRVGAIDYLTPPLDGAEISATIDQLIKKKRPVESAGRATFTSLINAKGGAGSSLIASNLSHIMACSSEQRVVLMDMDMQFGGLCHYFDMKPKYGLYQALQHAREMDEVAMEGYMLKHDSGLRLLDIIPSECDLSEELQAENLGILFNLIADSYDHVFMDIPRHISAVNGVALEYSDNIIIVLQQNISHLRDARRLVDMLVGEMGIDSGRIKLALNRFSKKAELQAEDVVRAVGKDVSMFIPNAFGPVSESVNQGSPLQVISPRSTITRAFRDISDSLLSNEPCVKSRAGRLGRFLRNRKGVR